jgi:hypothetical protein
MTSNTMRKLVAGIALAALTANSTLADDASMLVGVWKLTSWTRHEVVSGKEVKLFGEKPVGYIIFTKGGHFSWQGYDSQRMKPAEANPTDTERGALFKTMYAYEGTYEVEGGGMTQNVEHAWNQGWVGTKFGLAKYEVSGNSLTLVSKPFKSTVDGTESFVTTTYERLE